MKTKQKTIEGYTLGKGEYFDVGNVDYVEVWNKEHELVRYFDDGKWWYAPIGSNEEVVEKEL